MLGLILHQVNVLPLQEEDFAIMIFVHFLTRSTFFLSRDNGPQRKLKGAHVYVYVFL